MIAFSGFPNFQKLQTIGHKPHPKSKFTAQEDEKLRQIVSEIGENDWAAVSKRMGNRNMRQCKERWTNYLSPNVKVLPWTPEDDKKLEALHEEFGAKWVRISQFFPSRTDTNIKSRWMVLQRQKRRLENKSKQAQNSQKNSYLVTPTQQAQPVVAQLPVEIPNQIQSNVCENNMNPFWNELNNDNEFEFDITPIDMLFDQSIDFDWN